MCALPITFGRDSGVAAVALDDRNVSRRHARLEIIDNDLVLTDLGSTNGTYVNDERVTRRRCSSPGIGCGSAGTS